MSETPLTASNSLAEHWVTRRSILLSNLPTDCPFRIDIEGGDEATQEGEGEPVVKYKLYEPRSDKKISKTSTAESSCLETRNLTYSAITQVHKPNGIRYLYLFACNDSHQVDETKEVVEDLVVDDEYDSDVQFMAVPPNDDIQFKKEFKSKAEKHTSFL